MEQRSDRPGHVSRFIDRSARPITVEGAIYPGEGLGLGVAHTTSAARGDHWRSSMATVDEHVLGGVGHVVPLDERVRTVDVPPTKTCSSGGQLIARSLRRGKGCGATVCTFTTLDFG